MLHDFLSQHSDAIIERARAKVAARRVPVASTGELTRGVPMFLAQLTDLLRDEHRHDPGPPILTTDERAGEALGDTADRQGDDVLRAGLTVAQVVEGYGDVCQAIMEHATVMNVNIGSDEYGSLNLCLDVATARAVTAFSRARDRSIEERNTERLGALAHEMRNLVAKALLSYQALQRGVVGVESRTGALLGHSLRDLRDLVDRSLTEVRLAAMLHSPERVPLGRFIEEIEVGAALDAKARGLVLNVPPVDEGLAVTADRQLLASAVSNLLQNAVKFTAPGGQVSLTARPDGGRVFIDVQDECGGLPAGRVDELFRPFESRGVDRTGLGLGLKIARDAVRANGGEIRVRNLPGEGCIFTVDLPASR